MFSKKLKKPKKPALRKKLRPSETVNKPRKRKIRRRKLNRKREKRLKQN